jgi:hypothetical protein
MGKDDANELQLEKPEVVESNELQGGRGKREAVK